jgi:hypothetical protein
MRSLATVTPLPYAGDALARVSAAEPLLIEEETGPVLLHQHSFDVLRSTLGAPARTFRYMGSGLPNCEDHVWRCGCAAREVSGMCDLVPCGRHGELNRTAFLNAAWAERRDSAARRDSAEHR